MILQNALKLKDGDDIVYLKSAHVHDYVSYDFKNGDYASVDGGNEYFRAGWLFKDGSNLRNNPNVERYHLETDSSIDEIREKLLWGSRGKDGKQKLTYSPIKDLTLEHLQAIIDNVKDINSVHKAVIAYWILEKQNK